MRTIAPLTVATTALTLLLSACAGGQARECAKLAGPGWTPMSSPPPAAGDLLSLENLPQERNLVWFNKGPDRVIVCEYANGLVNPGCGGSKAYEFAHQSDGHWVSRGALLDFCDDRF